jgi:hypothetical protein
MLRLICVALLLFVAAPAFAKGKHHQRGAHSASVTTKHVQAKRHFTKRVHRTKYARVSGPKQHVRGGDPRPRAWCGWWLRQQMGVADRSYNLARKWAQIGTAAHGPAPGVIAVWRHHVGIVTGVPGPGRIVLKSGNDSRAVRERERSTRGVIAYRWPPGRVFASAF